MEKGELFEKLKGDLQEYVEGRIDEVVKNRYESSRQALLEVYSTPDSTSEVRRLAEYEHALNAMAFDPLQRTRPAVHNPLLPDAWARGEKARLAEFILLNPKNHRPLRNSIFFADRESLRMFARSVDAAIEPANTLEGRSLAAAVALGRVSLRER